MSVRENEVANGCTVGSSRHAPSSKPSRVSTSSRNSLLRRDRIVPVQERSSAGSPASRTIAVSSGRRTSKTARPRRSSSPARTRREGVVRRVAASWHSAQRSATSWTRRKPAGRARSARRPRLEPGRRVPSSSSRSQAARARPARAAPSSQSRRLTRTQAGVVRVVVELRRQRLGALEQARRLRRRRSLVGDAAQRRERLRPGGRVPSAGISSADPSSSTPGAAFEIVRSPRGARFSVSRCVHAEAEPLRCRPWPTS